MIAADIEKSLKARLRNAAKELKRRPDDLWQSLILERFLVRLARSRHCDNFVLKGGVLLAKYLFLGRETKDLDFLALNFSNNTESIRSAFAEIAALDMGDGFLFKEVDTTMLEHLHMAYAGVEVTMAVYYGRTRFRVTIDVGFGDTVQPTIKQFDLLRYSKGAFFEEHVSLVCYPQEFIFAEKLETVVYRGGDNSRMKDFHDLYNMVHANKLLHLEFLNKVMTTVFNHRGTPFVCPIVFEDFQLNSLQLMWNRYLQGMRRDDRQHLPPEIIQLLAVLNAWLKQVIENI